VSQVLSFAYLGEQQVELLPARTVLSLFAVQGSDSDKGGSLGLELVKMLGISGSTHGTDGAPGTDGNNSGGNDN
jgi:hypothetical protein